MAKQISSAEINRLIGLFNQGQFTQAENLAQSLLKIDPRAFVCAHILALSQDSQQKYAPACKSYQQAIDLQPKNADLYFNLGTALLQLNEFKLAENAFLQATQLNPHFFEAFGNLGLAQQRQGRLIEAIASYETGLKINPQDARGFFNLATAQRDNGDLAAAVQSNLRAITLFPNYTDAHNNLGETFRDQGNMPDAVKAYQAALALNPQHARANYNMAEFFVMSKNYAQAIDYFEQSQLDDWQERTLYCLYQDENFAQFNEKRAQLLAQKPHTSPFLATLSTHYSHNFNAPDPYNFCKNALDFVYHTPIAEIQPGAPLLSALLNDIETAKIAERTQGRLMNGMQSAGNLFKRPEDSFRQLAEIIKSHFAQYHAKFAQADCTLISHFPQDPTFASAWFVKMQTGGHLSAHIHEIGWLSGAVYLAMPPKNGDEGAFEYGTHGDNYPQKTSNFASAKILPNIGDIILFPSSLFHRTIPFHSDSPRICIAFDLQPAP